jgi:hypothetical protein
VLFDVGALTVLPGLVSHDTIAAANGQLEAARAVAQTSGPALGGALVHAVTAPVAVAIDALSYVVSGLLLRALPRTAPPEPSVAGGQPRLLALVRDGLRFCLRHPYIRPLAVAAAWMNFWTEALRAVLVVYAVRDLQLGAPTVGIALAAANVGYLAGSVLVPRLNRRFGVGPVIAVGAALNGAFLLVAVPSSQTGRVTTLAALVVGLGVAAAGVALWNVDAVSLRQASTPAGMLARMNATNRFLIWGTMPLGAASAGLLSSTVGLRATVLLCGLAAPLSALPVLASAVRHVRTMPVAEAASAPRSASDVPSGLDGGSLPAAAPS